MPILKKNFQEMDRFTIGVVGIVTVLALIGLSLNSGAIIRSFTSDEFRAEFPEAGNLQAADEVRLGGLNVGRVLAVDLEGDRVVVDFSVERGGTLGQDTRAAIKTASPLGKKFLQILPSGPGTLETGSTIPLERTNSPFDVTQVLSQLTSQTGQIDTAQLAGSLRTLSDTFRDTPPELQNALVGVSRISETIASRDAELRTLLANADAVTGILADRRQQLQQIFADGNLLLAELNARRDAIRALLLNATAALEAVNTIVQDNREQIGPVLDELEGVTDLLIRNEKNISASITGLNNYGQTLGEAVGGGPWFYAFIPNLVPSNLLPPLTDLLDPGLGAPLPPPFDQVGLPVVPGLPAVPALPAAADEGGN